MQWDSTSQSGKNTDTQEQMELYFILKYLLNRKKIAQITPSHHKANKVRSLERGTKKGSLP